MCGIFASASIADCTPLPILRNSCAVNLQIRRAGVDRHPFVNGDLGSMLKVLTSDGSTTLRGLAEAGKQRSFGKRTVQPKSANQRRYLEAIEKNDMVFGIGPAGTGKTYLA